LHAAMLQQSKFARLQTYFAAQPLAIYWLRE
jgi:hypothetical protein